MHNTCTLSLSHSGNVVIFPPLSLSLSHRLNRKSIYLGGEETQVEKTVKSRVFRKRRNCPTRKTEFRVMRHRIRLLAILRQITRLLRNVYFSTSAARLPIKRL